MLRLTIHHNIHLTKEERYALHQGQEILVIGVSIPVWTIRNITSEPGQEVFCYYHLKNPKTETPIQILNDGYEITLPYREGGIIPLSDEEFRNLNYKNPIKLDEIYSKTVKEVSSKNLLDIADGGSELLSYRELNKISIKEKDLQIMHHVSISTIEKLKDSLN